MNRWTPCKRRDSVRRLKKLGFDGPFSGTRHQFMVFQNHRLALPSNPEYSVPQLKMLLSEIELIVQKTIFLSDWESMI